MKRARLILLAGSLVAALAYAGNAAAVPIEAVTFSGSDIAGVALNAGPVPVGFYFSVSSPIQVTDLGAFDQNGDGFANSHAVGIYDGNTAALVASTTVSSSDPLAADDFRYHAITPITLNINTTYIVAAADYNGSGQDSFVLVANSLQNIAPDITTYGGAITSSTYSGLHYPGNLDSSYGYFGGNFRYVVAPEPSEANLLAAGLLGLIALRGRRRRIGARAPLAPA